jgi:hypothetical protein
VFAWQIYNIYIESVFTAIRNYFCLLGANRKARPYGSEEEVSVETEISTQEIQ